MSIATKKGDGGETSLVQGGRVSKSDLRIEAYGTLDELGSVLGFARSICPHKGVREATRAIQKELFHVSASLGGGVTDAMVAELTRQVDEIEKREGIIGDWALPGENAASAAYDVARTVCRRAERVLVRMRESGLEVDGNTLRYVNRLSDLLWLYGRLVELEAGIDSRMREGGGANWSRAW